MEGAAGPSGMDAIGWRRLCTSFGRASHELCHSLAAAARRLCTSLVEPKCISSLMACRLIALSKNPGVRPIGVGETARRIMAKAVLSVIRSNVQDAAGTLQLCAGQVSGIEAAAHSVRSLFEDSNSEAALLVDASNAFNSLNRQVALQNIRRHCPSLANILINTYREPSQLFVDGDTLLSREGTTQGDPLAMPMYAIATIPLIRRLDAEAWYADDAATVGKLADLRRWWGCDRPHWTKLWLLCQRFQNLAGGEGTSLLGCSQHFEGTSVRITTKGRLHLGAPIGLTTIYRSQGRKELNVLADIVRTATCSVLCPYAWLHQQVSHVVPDIKHHLLPLEEAIRTNLLPQLTGWFPPGNPDRQLMALPARLGGLGITNPAEQSPTEYEAPLRVTVPLMNAIVSGYSYNILVDQLPAQI